MVFYHLWHQRFYMEKNLPKQQIFMDLGCHLALDVCDGVRPQIPEYAPKPYVTLMKHCWDPIPTNRPTAKELFKQFNNWEEIIWDYMDFYDENEMLPMEQEVEEAFSKEREDKWKARLAELATNPPSLKKSQNLF